jgi:hypothetical protein
MRICIRTRVMRLMSDRAYAYAYGRLYIYGAISILSTLNIYGIRYADKPTALPVFQHH